MEIAKYNKLKLKYNKLKFISWPVSMYTHVDTMSKFKGHEPLYVYRPSGLTISQPHRPKNDCAFSFV